MARNICKSFSIKIEEEITIAIELKSIIEGLILCWDMGLKNVIVNCDAKSLKEANEEDKPSQRCTKVWG